MASFDAFKKFIEREFQSLVTKSYVTEVGKFTADMIRKRAQLGYGVSKSEGPRSKLKALSESYKTQRKKMKLNENTSPSKSNLTRTGQLLSSLDVTEASATKVVVGPRGRRDDGKTNEDVGEYVSKQGRPFNNVSDIEKKRIVEKVRKDLQAQLVKALAKLK